MVDSFVGFASGFVDNIGVISVPTFYNDRSLPLVIPTCIKCVIFFPNDENNMSWHAIFVINLSFIIRTLHLKKLFEVFTISNFTLKKFLTLYL
jgi:hypothetical protein